MASRSTKSKNTLKNKGGAVAFLRRHEQALTIIAAFVVFATFMIREEARENLKDIVASIDSSKTTFASRRDTSILAEQLNDVGIFVIDIAASVIKGTYSCRDGQFYHF